MKELQDIADDVGRLNLCPTQLHQCLTEEKKVSKPPLEGIYVPYATKFHPEAYRLKELDWLVVGTLTWKVASRRRETDLASHNRLSDFDLLIAKTSYSFKRRHKEFPTVLTQEFHDSGEVHFHFLMLKLPRIEIDPQKLSKVMKDLWEVELRPLDLTRKGIGTAQIEPYDSHTHGPAGVLYLCKRQFRRPDKDFTFSKSFWRAIKSVPK